jgi:hypothetical protein
MIKKFEQYNNEKIIHDLCREYVIENYTINEDGSIDVDGSVLISNNPHLKELPLRFNKVSGFFNCSRNSLTTLDGCPKEVGGYFSCGENQLTSLIGCPEVVGYGFDCWQNEIENLEGLSSRINGNLVCTNNRITSLKGGPMIIDGSFHLDRNPISIVDASIEVKSTIYIEKTNIDMEILTLFNEEKQLVFEHGIEYNIYNKDGSINKYRLDRLLKDFEEE